MLQNVRACKLPSVGAGGVAACSRAAAVISTRLVLGTAIAAKPARRLHVAGRSGRPSGGIGLAKKAEWRVGNNHVAGERGSESNEKRPRTQRKPPRMLRRQRRAWVITATVWEKKVRAIGRDVMQASIVRIVLPGSVSVRPYAARLYVLFVCGRDVGTMSAAGVR